MHFCFNNLSSISQISSRNHICKHTRPLQRTSYFIALMSTICIPLPISTHASWCMGYMICCTSSWWSQTTHDIQYDWHMVWLHHCYTWACWVDKNMRNIKPIILGNLLPYDYKESTIYAHSFSFLHHCRYIKLFPSFRINWFSF